MYSKEQPSHLSDGKAKSVEQSRKGYVSTKFENQKAWATIFESNQSESDVGYNKSDEERNQSQFIFEHQF